MASQQSEDAGQRRERAKLPSLLVAFRLVGVPLMQAMAEAAASAAEGSSKSAEEAGETAGSSDRFAELIDSAVALSSAIASGIKDSSQGEADDASLRWELVGPASQVVAAHYRASGHAMTADEAAAFSAMTEKLQEKFKVQIPAGGDSLPNTLAAFRSRMMEAMVPVIGAVSQYSFGRAEHALLAEISERLIKTADQVTRALAPSGATPEEWRMLCWNILRSSGQIYTECHYAEADRLLYMDADERAAYFGQHGGVIPMVQVWQAFNQRMAMLATLAAYLEVPESAQLDRQGWP